MQSVLEKLDIADESPGVFCGEWRGGGGKIDKISPIDGRKLASVRTASAEDYEAAISFAHEAFLKWRVPPGPVRGETARRLAKQPRTANMDLGKPVPLKPGKIDATA